MSIYSLKSANAARGPWTWTWSPGVNLENFFALYGYHALADANGDATVSSSTSLSTTLDGPIQVAKFHNLTVNAALTTLYRNRGLLLLAEGLTMGAAGSISMTARGAIGSRKWDIGRDIFIPQSITFTGTNTRFADFLAWIKSTGYCIFDPLLYVDRPVGLGDVTCDWATWTPLGTTLISYSGCGAGGTSAYNQVGFAGAAGTKAPGGGASGAAYQGYSFASPGAPACVWGGGSGSGGGNSAANYPLVLPLFQGTYGGPGGTAASLGGCIAGGGAGNPGGAGVFGGSAGGTGSGGVLLAIASSLLRKAVFGYGHIQMTAAGMIAQH